MSGRGGVAQHSSREAAYQFCIGALRDSGTVCDESFEKALREHLWRLPSRYAAEVESAEDVATHLRLLEEVRRDSSRVAVAARAVSVGGDAAAARDAAAAGSPPAHNTPDSPGGVKLGSSTGKRPPTFGSSLNLLALEDQSPVASSGLRGEGGGNSALVCHELAVAAGNRPRLLSNLTAIFGEIGLNINEAHVFCTDDGFALDVFVVDGWHTEEPEGLQDTLTRLMQAPPTPGGAPAPVASPPAAQPPPEAKTGANDWEVDPNRLTFLDKVASGSFGDLFRGMYNGQEVAIKVLRLAQHNDQAHLIREFTQELSVLRKVRHKNVVQLIGASTTPPKLCIVTEFMRRGSLLDYLHRAHPLKLSVITKLSTDVARGMDYLHKCNIIHRDLKSANLLMNEHGDCKVADFGVARIIDPVNVMTAETGTYRWMAPEVVSHQAYNHKCDVFSYGILLWEMVTGGAVPYAGFTPLQAAVGVVQKGLRPVTPEGCNLGLLRLMQLCWDSYPAARPDFEQVLQILPTISEEQLPEPMISSQSSGPPGNPAVGGGKEKQGFFARMRRNM